MTTNDRDALLEHVDTFLDAHEFHFDHPQRVFMLRLREYLTRQPQPHVVETVEELEAIVQSDPYTPMRDFGGALRWAHEVLDSHGLRLPATVLTPATLHEVTASEPTEAEVEAAARSLEEHALGTTWGDDGITFVGCDCGEWFGKELEDACDRAREHQARAALRAARGVKS